MTTRLFTARYAGCCSGCASRTMRGDLIEYDPRTKAIVKCPACRDKRGDTRVAELVDRAYEDACAAACGLDGPGR